MNLNFSCIDSRSSRNIRYLETCFKRHYADLSTPPSVFFERWNEDTLQFVSTLCSLSHQHQKQKPGSELSASLPLPLPADLASAERPRTKSNMICSDWERQTSDFRAGIATSALVQRTATARANSFAEEPRDASLRWSLLCLLSGLGGLGLWRCAGEGGGRLG